MEDDLKNVRRPQNGRQHQKWKMTSKMEDNLKNGRPSFVLPSFLTSSVDYSFHPFAMTLVTLISHRTKNNMVKVLTLLCMGSRGPWDKLLIFRRGLVKVYNTKVLKGGVSLRNLKR